MSCRENRASSAITTMARLDSGDRNTRLPDALTLSLFHAIRAQYPESTPDPSDQEWQDYLDQQIEAVRTNETYTEARRQSLIGRLTAGRSQRPDGRTWRAMHDIPARARMQAQALDNRLQGIAEGLQVDVAEVRRRYLQAMEATPRTRRGANPDGYTDQMGINAVAAGLPIERSSIMALHNLQRDALRARADRALNGPQRIERTDIGSGLIAEAGYDPNGGRLELVFRGRNGAPNGRVYAYRGVPQHVWDRFATGEGARTYNDYIRNHPEYRYATQEEADLDSAARQCADCGQFASSTHHCPPRVAREEAAAAQQRAAEEAAAAQAEAARAADAEAVAAQERAAAAVTQERPEVRTATSLGISNSGRRRWSDQGGTGRYDYGYLPNLTMIRSQSRNGPVEAQFTYSGNYRYSHDNADGLPGGSFQVTGTVTVDQPERGNYVINTSNLRCWCYTYRTNGDCPHLNYVAPRIAQAIQPAAGSSRTPADTAAVQAAAEAALRQDWMRNEALAAEAARSWAPSAPEDRYSENFEAFEADYQEALARKALGHNPIPYMTENATGGLCTRETGRGFGVELEFDFPPGVNRYEALRAIGQELYEAGLTSTPRQQGYHAGQTRGYTDNHRGGWSYEMDCTVAGEIVSPVMYDEPETWENIAKVCEIVKRHGGKASARTGSHVHVSSPNTTAGTATELIRMANQHEDVMYRVSQNPERGRHRPMRWCGPNRDVIPNGYATVSQAFSANYGHHLSVNLQSVSGQASDHPEIRHWDGTLDPAAIQAQIKISTAMVAAAQRNGVNGGTPHRNREPVGSHARRMQAVVGRSRRGLTSEELKDDSATARSFADTLFTRREDKAQFAALFAATKWHKVR